MKNLKILLSSWFIVLLGLFSLTCKSQSEKPLSKAESLTDSDLKITIEDELTYTQAKKVTLENSIYKAVLRTRERNPNLIKAAGGEYGTAILDWIIKSNNQDQISWGMNASEHWTHCVEAYLTYDGDDKKIVRLIHSENDFIIDYTIFPNSPVIKIDYINYYNKKHGWFNIVDIGTPGGIKERHKAVTKIYGQERWIHELQYHEESYWNIFKKDGYNDDPTAGSLNYKDHLIMVLANPENGVGYGRVMPIYKEGDKGGTRILKLLWDIGFENFAGTGQSFRPPFSGYIFIFETGLDNAMELGKSIVDGNF